MAVSTLGYVIIRLTLPIALFRDRKVKADANAWAEVYGGEAVAVLRSRIADCRDRRERRRLYRVHDEIARRDPNGSGA